MLAERLAFSSAASVKMINGKLYLHCTCVDHTCTLYNVHVFSQCFPQDDLHVLPLEEYNVHVIKNVKRFNQL